MVQRERFRASVNGSSGSGTSGNRQVLIEGLDFSYPSENGNVTVFHDFNLTIDDGEVICLIGPSGCGKTTLLKCIGGLVKPTAGQIRFGDEVVSEPRPDIAMVFQHFGLLPWKTVYDNIAFGLRIRGLPEKEIRERVRHYVDLVQLSGFEKFYPYQLSGGMQQRVGLARALALRPKLLLMDEPFGALDAQTREVLQQELLQILQRENMSVVFVTHSIDEALLLGDRVVVLTKRPCRIKHVERLQARRAGESEAFRNSPEFSQLRSFIWNILQIEVDVAG